MKWVLRYVGKPALAYAREGVALYHKRLGRYASVELNSASSKKERSKVEVEWSGEKQSGKVVRIVLDERGEAWSTRQWVSKVEGWQLQGVAKVECYIGGADGHSKVFREEADHVVSLAAATMQHELALLVLSEQLYRVHTCLKGEPYHREG